MCSSVSTNGSHVFKCGDIEGLTSQHLEILLHLYGCNQNHLFVLPFIHVKTASKVDTTFPSPNKPDCKLCRLLTDSPCEWDRAGGESTQNANHLVATDWITPLFMQNSPQCPTVGICCSCRSFIRTTIEVSLLHHIIWLLACAASTMTHNHLGRQ